MVTGRQSEAGFTLIEILVAMVILGLAVVAILGGLGTLTDTTGENRVQANVGAVVRSAAEAVKASTYQLCSAAGFPGNYLTAVEPISGGGTFTGLTPADPPNDPPSAPTIVQITSLGGATVYWTPATGTVANCSDKGIQLIELNVEDKNQRISEYQWVVKASVAPNS